MRKGIHSSFWVFLLLMAGQQVFAQGNFPGGESWKRYQEEVIIGVGASTFLGDLGGLDKVGTDYSPVDMEFALIHPSITLGYRYRFAKSWAWTTTFSYAKISGADSLTKEPFRYNRNLHFKSNIFELATRVEFGIHLDQIGHRYSFRTSSGGMNKGFKNRDHFIYFFGGVGLTYFNPKGELDGEWYELQPLGTEGQGLTRMPDHYSRFTVVIPAGMGYKTRISDAWSIGIELGYRKTFTDYMDDVSTEYYDKTLMEFERGPEAAHFSNPTNNSYVHPDNFPVTSAGQQRGDPTTKDAYVFAQLTFVYNIGMGGGIGQRMSGGKYKYKIKL